MTRPLGYQNHKLTEPLDHYTAIGKLESNVGNIKSCVRFIFITFMLFYD